MHIDAVYDFPCPWCLIAKRQLAQALPMPRWQRRRGVSAMPHFQLHFADGTTQTITTTSVEAFADALRRDRAGLAVIGN